VNIIRLLLVLRQFVQNSPAFKIPSYIFFRAGVTVDLSKDKDTENNKIQKKSKDEQNNKEEDDQFSMDI
jgi:hypothetical protein